MDFVTRVVVTQKQSSFPIIYRSHKEPRTGIASQGDGGEKARAAK